MTRREFIKGSVAVALAAYAKPWRVFGASGMGALVASEVTTSVTLPDAYSVAILGDTHFDAEPESFYHSRYDETNKYAKIQHEEFRRNGEMWRERCRSLLAASGRLAAERPTAFALQLGDLVQGDCDDVATHFKMLAEATLLMRGAYPAGMPFMSVMGNHDIRGKGAKAAYFGFAEPYMAGELKDAQFSRATAVKYPVFSFRRGDDLWVFCNFEERNLDPVSDAIDADTEARRVFLVTHGPVTAHPGGSYRWRLGGHRECDASRPRFLKTLFSRRAIVISGHTHTTAFYRHESVEGGFTEFTVNSVWHKPELATAEPEHSTPAEYGALPKGFDPKKAEDFAAVTGMFKPTLKEYFFNNGAGHYRLNVSSGAVTMEFYPGDALSPARTFQLA